MKRIISAGLKYGGFEGHRQLPASQLANPYHRYDLKHMTGLDEPVQEFIRSNTKDLNKMVDRYAKVIERAESGTTFFITCIGGKHRSVYLAMLLGERLNLPVEHRDILK